MRLWSSSCSLSSSRIQPIFLIWNGLFSVLSYFGMLSPIIFLSWTLEPGYWRSTARHGSSLSCSPSSFISPLHLLSTKNQQRVSRTEMLKQQPKEHRCFPRKFQVRGYRVKELLCRGTQVRRQTVMTSWTRKKRKSLRLRISKECKWPWIPASVRFEHLMDIAPWSHISSSFYSMNPDLRRQNEKNIQDITTRITTVSPPEFKVETETEAETKVPSSNTTLLSSLTTLERLKSNRNYTVLRTRATRRPTTRQ